MGYYSPGDAFNTPVDVQPAIHSQNTAWMSLINFHAGSGNITSSGDWGIPVYHAAYSDPLVTVTGNTYQTTSPFTFHCPIVAKGSTGSDHQCVIISPDGIYETDVWGFGRDGSGNPTAWSIWQQLCDVHGRSTTGKVANKIGGTTGSGIQKLSGLILASELSAGFIPHALAYTLPETAPSFVAPARQSDGHALSGVPEGQRLQLDPNYDPSQLPDWHQTICRALQTYGAYLVDTGGSLAVQAESPFTGIYAANVDGKLRGAFPWSHMRFLA